MKLLLLLFGSFLLLDGVTSSPQSTDRYPQYTHSPYNPDPNNPYDRDRNNAYDRDRNNPYNRDNPYDRDHNRSYNPYNSDNRPYNDPNRPYNDPNRPYDSNRPYNPSDPSRPYGSDSRPYNPNNPPNNPDHRPYGPDNRPYNPDNRYNQDRPYGSDHDRNYNAYSTDRPYDPNQPYNPNSPYNPNRPYDRNNSPYQHNNTNYNRDGQYRGQDPRYNVGGNDQCCQEYCYSRDPDSYQQFGTKTSYQMAYGRRDNQHVVPDCNAVQFWSLNRHGARLPSRGTIQRLRNLNFVKDEIIRNYIERNSYPDRGRLCTEDFELLRRWRMNESIVEDRANELTYQGIEDIRMLARRYKSRFDQLFRIPYAPDTHQFKYTDTDRTHDSYQAYIEGLFGPEAYNVRAEVVTEDQLLKPTSSCEPWRDNVNRYDVNDMEYEKFKRRPEYQQMIREVARRLGYRSFVNESMIYDMYDMCRFERAWNIHQKAAWCAAFNTNQLKLYEFGEDLKYYYKSGYGNPISRNLGCMPVKDLYEKFERTVNGERGGPKISATFTHTVSFQTFLVAMGIARDDQPLTAETLYSRGERKWKTSKISPFAANLVAVLYECRRDDPFRVMFFLNEEAVNFPECNVGLCNWETVRRKLENVARNCNSDYCNQWNGAKIPTSNYLVYIVAFISAYMYRWL